MLQGTENKFSEARELIAEAVSATGASRLSPKEAVQLQVLVLAFEGLSFELGDIKEELSVLPGQMPA